MKIVPDNQDQDNKVISAEQRHVREKKPIDQLRPRPGHKVWEFDLATGEINEAKVDEVSAVVNTQTAIPDGHVRVMGKPSTDVHKKITHRPNCLYCSALNKKNAIKKLIPMYEQIIADGRLVREEAPDGE